MKISHNRNLNIILGILLIVSVSLLCAFLLWYHRISPNQFRLGERSYIKLISTEEKTILDTESIEEERLKAKNEAINKFLEKPILQRNNSLNTKSLQDLHSLIWELDSFFTFRDSINSKYIADEKIITFILLSQKEEAYKLIHKKNTSNKFIKSEIQEIKTKWKGSLELNNFILDNEIFKISSGSWLKIKSQITNIAQIVLNYGYPGSLDAETIKSITIHSHYSEQEINFIKLILEAKLKPNLKIYFDDLNSLENKIALKIKPIWRTLPSGSTILMQGELITKEKFSTLEQLGLNKRKEPNWKVFEEAFWMTLLVIISFWLYVKLEKFQLSFRQVFLLSSIVIIASAFVGLFAYKEPSILPLAAVAMIIGLFFKPTVGFSGGILFGILCLQALSINATLVLPSFIGIIVGTILSQKAKNRADLARAGLWLGLSQIVAFAITALLSPDIPFTFTQVIIQGLSGLITALIVSSFMPYLESLFGVITRFRFLELSDSNQPLLQKLHDEAPGTYEHTLVVADLAQDAAKRIEADYELVRVGILYHDIGKLYNPKIFIENQFGSENPHEKMTAEESAKAIIAHVPEGIKLAKKYGLPEPIIYFIPAHQGTSRAGHFFLKACQESVNLKDDTNFRYPGPRPNSKETGIAMLADTVEATIRSLKTSDTNLVKETINNLIEARRADGQLMDSKLNNEELNKIAESFYESWKNKNHERVRYISDLRKT